MADRVPRMLFLMSDTGGGHRAAAEAICLALPDSFQSQAMLIDFLAEGSRPPFDQIGRLYRPTVDYAPLLWAALFRFTSSAMGLRASLALLERVSGPGIARILRNHRADLVISVHPLTNHIPAQILHRIVPEVPLVTVVTDLATAHPLWFCPDVDHCLVPSIEAQRRALRAGIPAAKVRVAGLPISPAFTGLAKKRDHLRQALGLSPDRYAILIVGGGEGMGHLDRFAAALDNCGLPIQLVIVAGRNERLQARLTKQTWNVPTIVYGFVHNMPELMTACDAIITKAGPGTVSEALAAGLPILFSGYIPGQEEGNVAYVIEGEAGAMAPTPELAVARLRAWLAESPQTLLTLSENARRLAHPRAAKEIAQILLNIQNRTGAPPQGFTARRLFPKGS
ncbi:MAG: glycosyltransferase [Chloroflexi bacterium]|nr:glycosyltransferase [Chloroflexota bacterium]